MTYTFIGGKNREEFPEFEELFELVESQMGYLPNAYLAMAEKPELLNSFSSLISALKLEDIQISPKWEASPNPLISVITLQLFSWAALEAK